MPWVTGRLYAAMRIGVMNWSSGSTKPLKNTDASSTNIESWTAWRSESTIVEINSPSPSDAKLSNTTTQATLAGVLSNGTFNTHTISMQIIAAMDRLKNA